MSNKTNTINFYLPIILLLSWLIFTIISFAYGPYHYDLINPIYFYLYLLLIHCFLFSGYKVGLKSRGRDFNINISYIKLIKCLSIASFYYNFIKLIFHGGSASNVLETFNDASLSYDKNISGQFSGIFSYMDMIFIRFI